MLQIVLHLPEQLKSLAWALQAAATAATELLDSVSSGSTPDYTIVETQVAQQAQALKRALHQDLLQALDIDAPFVHVDGRLHAQVGRYPATYYTLAGPVTVERSLYRPVEERNAKTVDAVSLRAGVVAAGWLPQTARAMAYALEQGTSREAEQLSEQWQRLPYSRSSFEDVGHAVGELLVGNHSRIEEKLIAAYKIPPEACSVSVGIDRVSIPMEEERPRPVGRPRADAPKRPVQCNYRMAYCGTVTLQDRQGRALHTIRYARMPEGDAEGLAVGLADDVIRLLEQCPPLEVQLLCDGAPEMWNLLDKHINETTVGKPVHRLIDFYHLMEKLGEASSCLGQASKSGGGQLGRWKLLLLNRSDAAKEILVELKESGGQKVRGKPSSPSKVKEAMTYLENHARQMDYATARSRGLAISSGSLEATCKSLVNQRMKRSGSRWKERTGE